jgi:D-glycero-D-manno-heptose 1,7-bisphosphate phosphatase
MMDLPECSLPRSEASFCKKLRTVFLDRDGVLNEKMPEGKYVTCWREFRILPGIPEAIAQLNKASVRVIVVSNQRGISLGLYSAADVDAIHKQFQNELQKHGAHVDKFYFCPHDKRSCQCRKPLPGLFEQAFSDFPEIRPVTSVMIGDSLSDIEFGHNLGMPTIFIDGQAENQKLGANAAAELSNWRFPSLPLAVDALLQHR